MTSDHLNNIDLDRDKMPSHLAIIMDGNGRWANKRGLPRHFGHQEGMKRVIETVEACKELGIKHLTLYAFSTENWKRPKIEVDSLMNLLVVFIRGELKRLIDSGVRLQILGEISKIPDFAAREVERALAQTSENDEMILNIALNYGGRQEILKAVREITIEVKNGELDPYLISEEVFARHLYTKNQPDPDLIIRPSGELRLSNFLIYQAAYSEFWFSDVLWPDFNKEELVKAIADYQKRSRRFGGV
ncbi:MAG: isoprenyl transferase [Gudongella sp.]|jgi:undecaprenyl diphosphate synthase|nr:isoprenyl transferase [Gudongella sp.]